jgi:hypothetical protein
VEAVVMIVFFFAAHVFSLVAAWFTVVIALNAKLFLFLGAML